MRKLYEKLRENRKSWIIILAVLVISIFVGFRVNHVDLECISVGGFFYLIGSLCLFFPDTMNRINWRRGFEEVEDEILPFLVTVSLSEMAAGILVMAGVLSLSS